MDYTILFRMFQGTQGKNCCTGVGCGTPFRFRMFENVLSGLRTSSQHACSRITRQRIKRQEVQGATPRTASHPGLNLPWSAQGFPKLQSNWRAANVSSFAIRSVSKNINYLSSRVLSKRNAGRQQKCFRMAQAQRLRRLIGKGQSKI